MASLYKRPTDREANRVWRDEKRKVPQTYWVKYVGNDGAVHRESLRLEVGSKEDKRKAEAVVAEATAKEKRNRSDHVGLRGKFSQWVIQFLNEEHANSPKTLHRYNAHWDQLLKFLNERKIFYPTQVRHEHAQEYVRWRVSKRTAHNTALQDLKFLTLVMNKALKLGYAQANPILRHGIKRTPPAEKPEFSDEDIATIRKELLNCDEWMRTAFEISLFTGCRVAETCINMKDVNLEDDTIKLHTKGGKIMVVPIHPALRPMLERFKKDGRKKTLELPGKGSYWEGTNTNHFSRFFSDLKARGLLQDPNATFHCCRVTYVSRMIRSGMDRDRVMQLVGHSSTLVNKIYDRTKATEISAKSLSAAGLPPPALL